MSGNRDAQARGRDVEQVDDDADEAVGIVHRGADRPRLAAGERRHGVEEMREAGEAGSTRLHHRLVAGSGVAGRDDDSGCHQPCDRRRRHALRRNRHQRAPGLERGEQSEVVLVHVAEQADIVDALALRRQERALDVNAERAGDLRLERRAGGGNGLAHVLARIGDEGRHEAGGAIGPVRPADRRDAFRRALVVEEHAAAAIDLDIDEARRQQTRDAPHRGAGGNVGVGHHSGDLPVGDHDGAAIDDVRAVEDAGAGEGNGHHRVSVTFIRCGGWSGSFPRARDSASASG